ncbi:hypothetical protein [Marinobacterium aestuariivivens]|uniref:Uncharacterized protein n=1 Tax=Marinobacterium aestuariivivens TaxID=1698799 RepID=A0ABW1ZVM4_9GAMM
MALAADCEVRPLVGIGSEIDTALERLYGEGQSQMGDILSEVAPGRRARRASSC